MCQPRHLLESHKNDLVLHATSMTLDITDNFETIDATVIDLDAVLTSSVTLSKEHLYNFSVL